MEIILNGEPQQVEENCTIEQLINKLSLKNQKFAVEINLEIVPRSQFETQVLSLGDKVEIVHAIGGG